jgi:predicted nuclease of restriction endonuclease-like (RecB) superfamily
MTRKDGASHSSQTANDATAHGTPGKVTRSQTSHTLPAEQSELAQQIIKGPYSFDFLSLGPDIHQGR